MALAGEALAAGGAEVRTAEQLARVAAAATGASATLLWRDRGDLPPTLLASVGLDVLRGADGDLADAAGRALRARQAVTDDELRVGAEGAVYHATSLQLGQPPIGALQLVFPPGHARAADDLAPLATFAVRAAHTLRTAERSETVAAELERTRALLAVVGQATAELSLAHTLETAVAHVGELLGVDRLALYLREDGRLYAAAGIGLAGPHTRLAERLLELALGPYRARGALGIADAARDPRLAPVGDAVAEAGVEAAVAVPLVVGGRTLGALTLVRAAPGASFTPLELDLADEIAARVALAVALLAFRL
jgi:hypothetical protein